jgi:hypothetical protein
MSKFNLSEAAKNILEGAKENLDASVASKRGSGDKGGKLSGEVAYGTKDVGGITSNQGVEATKGVPTATPPGATPPVGSEPMKKLAPQPGQSAGRADVGGDKEAFVQNDPAYVDRKGSGTPKQTMAKNPGATFQSYGEDSEVDDENVIEEEGKEDKENAAHERKEARHAKMKMRMKEDIDALLSGENLSEEFATKATTIFEAAVTTRVEEIVEEMENELVEQFQVAVDEIKEDLASKVDDYLTYMTEEWVKENQIAIDKGLRAEVVEDFIGGLHKLFAEHYIDIPEEKVDVVEELSAKVDELEEQYNAQVRTSIELKKELNEHKKIEAVHTVCEGLTQTQVEKMKSLAESIEYTTETEFSSKLETLKESYFQSSVKVATNSALDDEVHIEEEVKKAKGSSDSLIESYAKTISQTLVK